MSNSQEHEPITTEDAQTTTERQQDGASGDGDLDASGHTRQRVIIYGLLLLFAAFALNDYRLRTQWESESQTILDTLTHSKGLPRPGSDAEVLKSMREGKGIDTWLESCGYTLDPSRSTKKLRVFTKGSGLRSYWLVVDYHAGGTQEAPFLTTLNVTQQSYYAWDEKPAPFDKISGITEASKYAEPATGESQRGEEQKEDVTAEGRFDDLDKNDDEELTGDEIGDWMTEDLASFDPNGDGKVTKQEFLGGVQSIIRKARRAQSEANQAGGGLYDVPDDPGAPAEEADPNQLPEKQ